MSAAHWVIERRKDGWTLYVWQAKTHNVGRRIYYARRLRMHVAMHLAFAFGAKLVWYSLPDGQFTACFPPADPSLQ